MKNQSQKSNEYWMQQALDIAKKALERGEFPVGCILVSEGMIVGKGGRQNSRGHMENELDHAEIQAIRDWVARGKPGGMGFTAYTTLEPCLMCTGALILSGARRIVYSYEDVMGGAAGLDFNKSFSRGCLQVEQARSGHLYRDFNNRIEGAVLRERSIGLFQRFFSNSGNRYLKGSLLETYTLSLQSRSKDL